MKDVVEDFCTNLIGRFDYEEDQFDFFK